MKINNLNFKIRPTEEHWEKVDTRLRSNPEFLIVIFVIILANLFLFFFFTLLTV